MVLELKKKVFKRRKETKTAQTITDKKKSERQKPSH